MTNFPVWHLYHCPCAAKAYLRIFVKNNVTASSVLVQMVQLDLHKEFDIDFQFRFVEFSLENSILINCKKDLISHFIFLILYWTLFVVFIIISGDILAL